MFIEDISKEKVKPETKTTTATVIYFNFLKDNLILEKYSF